jgi:uncharacterized membrane protein YidH (DUF202 family)
MASEEQFVTAIDMIAEKLGIAATEIFKIFVGAQATIGILMIAECVMIILLFVGTYFAAAKLISGHYNYRDALKEMDESDKYVDEDMKELILAGPIIITVVLTFIFSLTIDTICNGVLRIMCPEYSAISEIIQLII